MIDIKKIRDDVAAYKLICQKRNMNIDVDWVLALDDERKQLQFSIDQAKAEQKQLATQQDYEWAKNLKVKIQELEAQHTEISAQLEKMLLKMPNTSLDPKIPVGKDDSENVVAEVFWEIPQFGFEPQSHIDLMKNLIWLILREEWRSEEREVISLNEMECFWSRLFCNILWRNW